MTQVALLEDDLDLSASTQEFLQAMGYGVWAEATVPAFWLRLQQQPVDVVVLDVGLPDADGRDVARQLAQSQRCGVVMVTGYGQLDERIEGLTSGADVYLVKPVDLRELAANIDAVARRRLVAAQTHTGRWCLDTEGWRLTAPNGVSLTLTAKEFLLVSTLTKSAQSVVTKAQLSSLLDGNDSLLSFNRLDVLLSRLRKKCEQTTGAKLPVRAVTALGYMMTVVCEVC
jgi:two-component system response regulator PhoP